MYSLDTLKDINNKQELKAYVKSHPLMLLKRVEDVRQSPDYAQVDLKLLEGVAGIELVDEYFVDSSGMGSENEPALTYSKFCEVLDVILAGEKKEGNIVLSCLTGVGQFQVYVGIFRKRI